MSTTADVLADFCTFMWKSFCEKDPGPWRIRLDDIERWFAEFHEDWWAFINSPGREPAYVFIHARLRLTKPEFYEIALSGLFYAMAREARPQPSLEDVGFPDDFPPAFPNDQSYD